MPRGRDGFWSIIRQLAATQGEFSVRDIDGESNVDAGHIRQYMRQLTRGGFVGVVREETRHNARVPVYRLLRDQKATPHLRADGKLVATAQERMWTAIRSLKVFGVRELTFAAATDTDGAPTQRAARLFINRLVAAGYLIVEGEVPALQTYRLKPKMNTGPQPPQRIRLRAEAMFDPNTKAIVGDDIRAEVQP